MIDNSYFASEFSGKKVHRHLKEVSKSVKNKEELANMLGISPEVRDALWNLVNESSDDDSDDDAD